MACLYIYRMTADTGFAPCAEKGLLTLACCKGGQMRGDKVINTGLRHRIGIKRDADYTSDDVYILGTYENKFLYLAKVTDVVTMEEYFSGMSKGRTDDIYSLKNGKLVRNDKLRVKDVGEDIHTDPGRVIRDIAGQYVLISDDYTYLGKDAVYIDIVAEHNAKFQETKMYKGKTADAIIKACLKYRDGEKHDPTSPFKKKGGCR